MGNDLAYGPVPSRRLGQSLGVNNIPPKICSYSCVYCQLGRTLEMKAQRDNYYTVQEIYEKVKKQVDITVKEDEPIDYISFVPDGEPTLDLRLGKEIETLKGLGYKIAVISNSTLIWDDDVKKDLCKADWVSLKIDALSPDVWKKINRPHKGLDFEKILEGISNFSRNFSGKLNTETMLVQGINDDSKGLEKIADKISNIEADMSYLSIPTRPPAEDWVKSPSEEKINEAYQIFSKKGLDVEYLIGYEGDTFTFTGDFEKDILSITSVHPMRERQVKKLLYKANEDWGSVEKLVEKGKLIETKYKGEKFFLRKLN